MNRRPGTPRCADRLAARPREKAGEREVRVAQGAQHAGLQRYGRRTERLDHLVRALVALAPLADAAMDDFLQLIAARQTPDVARAQSRPRIALDQHGHQLPDLVDIVARLPLRRRSIDDLARRRHQVHRPRRDAAAIALLPDDAEVTELQTILLADEHVHRRQVAMEQLTAVQLAEHVQHAGDLATGGRLGPPPAGARQERAQVAAHGTFENEAVEDAAAGGGQREAIEHLDRTRMVAQQHAEVRLTEPAVDVRADLDAHRFRYVAGAASPRRQEHLAEATDAEQRLNAIAEAGLRADNHLAGFEQQARRFCGRAASRDGAGRTRKGAGRRRRGRRGNAGTAHRSHYLIVGRFAVRDRGSVDGRT